MQGRWGQKKEEETDDEKEEAGKEGHRMQPAQTWDVVLDAVCLWVSLPNSDDTSSRKKGT